MTKKAPCKKIKMPKPEGSIPLSIIICTTGRCSVLLDSVSAALNQNINRADFEVIVVLNGEENIDESLFPKGIILVRQPELGLSLARNSGADKAKGKILLFIDDDAVASPDLAEKMLKAFSKDKNAGIVGGQIFLKTPNPRPEIILSGHEGLWSEFKVPFKKYRTVKEQYAYPYGACFGIRKCVLSRLGGFPVSYGRCGNNYAGGEETALCHLVIRNGWKIGIEPKAFVEHRVEAHRFSREHIKKTIRAGLVTAYKLGEDGYCPKWTEKFVRGMIDITSQELNILRKSNNTLAEFYKNCQLDAYIEIEKMLKNS
ncbi:MAG: glycosyltransferase family 2 protein [Clostridia bacterium]|nr:glycosyltransferase family 2 protein [Clostridia bacterium]